MRKLNEALKKGGRGCEMDVIAKLNELEEFKKFGYSPEELAEIIERDKKTKDSVIRFHDKDHVWINGQQFISQKKFQEDLEELKKAYAERIKTLSKIEPPTKLPQDVISLIDDAMLKQDRYVSLFYGSSGISIDIYPIVEEEK